MWWTSCLAGLQQTVSNMRLVSLSDPSLYYCVLFKYFVRCFFGGSSWLAAMAVVVLADSVHMSATGRIKCMQY